MFVKDALFQAKRDLKKERIISCPHLEAEILLAHLLGVSREELLSRPELELTPATAERYKKAVKKRKQGPPLAYLTKKKEFYGLEFEVNENVLIPRPETETLVEAAKEYIENTEDLRRVLIAEIGVGSGCISISLLKTCRVSIPRLTSTDVSKEALKTAYRNAKYHGTEDRIRFLYGSLLLPLLAFPGDIKKASELILVVNLPYLSEEKYKNSPSVHKEPKEALLGGEDSGLGLYKDLLHQINILRKRIPIKMTLLCEMDEEQIPSFQEMASRQSPFNGSDIRKDLAGYGRVVILQTDQYPQDKYLNK